jgi:hypothetical protein
LNCLLPQDQKTNRKKEVIIPRQATLDWLRSLQNALVLARGSGLEAWSQDNTVAALANGEVPGILVVCQDQEQKQWTGIYFLKYGSPQLCIEGPAWVLGC